jgi:hypothetical protein
MAHEQDIGLLDPLKVSIWREPSRRLCARIEDRQHDDVRAVWLFPISRRAGYVALLTDADKEIGLLPSLESLDSASRAVLEEELARAYFVPQISQIVDLQERFGVSEWQVETDRGPRTFEVRDREDIRVLGGTRVMITDADGNVLEIPDVTRLDRASQLLIESLV